METKLPSIFINRISLVKLTHNRLGFEVYVHWNRSNPIHRASKDRSWARIGLTLERNHRYHTRWRGQMSSLMKFFKGHTLEYRCSAKNRIRLPCLKFRCLLFVSLTRANGPFLITLFVNGFFDGNFDPLSTWSTRRYR